MRDLPEFTGYAREGKWRIRIFERQGHDDGCNRQSQREPTLTLEPLENHYPAEEHDGIHPNAHVAIIGAHQAGLQRQQTEEEGRDEELRTPRQPALSPAPPPSQAKRAHAEREYLENQVLVGLGHRLRLKPAIALGDGEARAPEVRHGDVYNQSQHSEAGRRAEGEYDHPQTSPDQRD